MYSKKNNREAKETMKETKIVHTPYAVWNEDKKKCKWKIEVYISRLEVHILPTREEAIKLYERINK